MLTRAVRVLVLLPLGLSAPSKISKLAREPEICVLPEAHRARVSTSHLSPVLPLSSSPLAPVVTRGAPVCCGCMLMRPIHLFVCVIWTLLVSTLHVPISTTHISFPPLLLLLPPVPRSSPSLKHPGACLPGSLPALACSGWVWDQRPLAACMQISRVVMKSRLHPSLTSR